MAPTRNKKHVSVESQEEYSNMPAFVLTSFPLLVFGKISPVGIDPSLVTLVFVISK
jgi:hypothetical protein